MSETEVEEISAEIVKLGAVDPLLVAHVLEEVAVQMGTGADGAGRGGVLVARELLEGSLGARRAETVMERIAKESGARVGGKLYSDALTDDKGDAPDYVDMMRHNIRQISAALTM